MANVKESLARMNELDGFIGACVVDSNSGMMLGAEGGGPVNLEVAAAGNTEVVRAKKRIRDKLGLRDKIEDILITLTGQYHLIRMVGTTMFLYVALDRQKSNLALARKELEIIDRSLDIERR